MTELEQYKLEEIANKVHDIEQCNIALFILVGLMILGALFLLAYLIWGDRAE